MLELRAAEPAQQAMLEDYLADLPLPDGARVLEVGCGTGAVARTRRRPSGRRRGGGPRPVAGVRRTTRRRLAEGRGRPRPTWSAAGPRSRSRTAPSTRSSSTRCSRTSPTPARRWPRRRGSPRRAGALAVFDGDYATTTVARRRPRPAAGVRRCGDGGARARSLPRAPPRDARARGGLGRRAAAQPRLRREREPGYILTLIDRGADTLVAAGRLGAPAADALKAEARRRVAAGRVLRPHRLREPDRPASVVWRDARESQEDT